MKNTTEPVDDQTVLRYLPNGEPDILQHHSAKACEPPCAFHAPSDHPLKEAPLNWRSGRSPFDGRRLLERICPDGIGHPDPDALAFANRNLPEGQEPDEGVHGCDGCCSGRRFDSPAPPDVRVASYDLNPTLLTVLGKRSLRPDDVSPLTGGEEHKVLSYSVLTGYELRTVHPADECVDDRRFVYYYSRALLAPPPGLFGADRALHAFLVANHELPLVSTCDLQEGELLTDAVCWEGDRLSARGRTRLALILNDNTAALRHTLY